MKFPFFFFFFLTSLSVIFLTDLSGQYSDAAESKIEGFTTDLISHDSPRSPFYNPSETNFQRLQNAFHRSMQRGKYFGAMMASSNDIQSDIVPGLTEYFMNISLGTPPVPMLGIADTGSDLIWRQCVPCSECYQQADPLFDPAASETYKVLACDNEFCQDLGQRASCESDNSCVYQYGYGTGDRYTVGYLSSDTLTIGSSESVSFPEIAFGCAHNAVGAYVEKHVGLIGLGGGPLSLVTQLSSQVGQQFSYCLVPLYSGTTDSSSSSTVSSKINFGRNGVVSGSETVSTPLIRGTTNTFYMLKLKAMSIGSMKRVEFSGFSAPGEQGGNIAIDSGSTLTYLPPDFYNEVESALKTAVGGQPISYPSGYRLCYRSLSNLEIPIITVHFTGADVQLLPLNTFMQVQEDLFCFTMIPSEDFVLYGNLAQVNFLVGYDLNNNMLSFKPTDCTKQ